MPSAGGISIPGVCGSRVAADGNVICAPTKQKVRYNSDCSLVHGLDSRLVSQEYFSNLDANFMRLDHANRPELNKGTVDFVVESDEYWAPPPLPRLVPTYFTPEPPPSTPREPVPLHYLFALDVSINAVESGFLQSVCTILQDVLYGGIATDGSVFEPCFPQRCRVGILTFDQTLHFYNLSVRVASMVHRIPLNCSLGRSPSSTSAHSGGFGRDIPSFA